MLSTALDTSMTPDAMNDAERVRLISASRVSATGYQEPSPPNVPGQETSQVINREFWKIDPRKMTDLRSELGLDGKDILSMTAVEKVRRLSVDCCLRRERSC